MTKKKKPSKKKSVNKTTEAPYYISTDSTNSDSSTLNFDGMVDLDKKKPKTRTSLKILKAMFSKVPDGLSVKILTVIFRKLIVNVPEDKREKYWEKFVELVSKLVASAAEGSARGMTAEMRDHRNF